MEITKVEKLTDEKWLNLFVATFRHDGKSGRWVYASRKSDPREITPRAEAVVVVPVLREAGQPVRLAVLKTFRVPIGDYVYELPAGLVEDGEAIEETVRRELREEAGLELVRIKRVSPPVYPSSGLTDECTTLVFADVRRVDGGKQELDGSEEIEVCLLDHAQVCALAEAPVRIDARLWCVLYHFQQLGRLE